MYVAVSLQAASASSWDWHFAGDAAHCMAHCPLVSMGQLSASPLAQSLSHVALPLALPPAPLEVPALPPVLELPPLPLVPLELPPLPLVPLELPPLPLVPPELPVVPPSLLLPVVSSPP